MCELSRSLSVASGRDDDDDDDDDDGAARCVAAS